MTQKQYELLRMINDAEERFERIIFYDNKEEVEKFNKEYGKEYEYLCNKQYVFGGISTNSELCMTEKGKKALECYEEKQEKLELERKKIEIYEKSELKKKKNRIINIVLWIISFIIGLLGIYFTILSR